MFGGAQSVRRRHPRSYPRTLRNPGQCSGVTTGESNSPTTDVLRPYGAGADLRGAEGSAGRLGHQDHQEESICKTLKSNFKALKSISKALKSQVRIYEGLKEPLIGSDIKTTGALRMHSGRLPMICRPVIVDPGVKSGQKLHSCPPSGQPVKTTSTQNYLDDAGRI